jgi:DNA polymerase-3 subunit delta'
MKSADASSDLESLPALKVLLRARAEGRMPHAVLLTGPNPELLQKVADRLASIHLEVADPIAHADCRVLRPSKRSRTIDIESVQEVVNDLHLMSVSLRRVVIVHEPDRLGGRAATSFLKTLEEPPAGTLIILQTTNYYAVMATVLSRCMRFHVGGAAPDLKDPAWADWLREFDKLMGRLAGAGTSTGRSTEVVIPLYALCARFEVLLELFVEEALKVAPPPPPTDQDEDDAEIAYEESIRRGIRTRMLAALEERLRLVGRAHPSCGLQVAAAVDLLEQARIRLELNYHLISALEGFFLRTLRAFAARPIAPTS